MQQKASFPFLRYGGKKLCRIRGMRTLWHNVTFSLQQGECLCIEGRNGSGKTSLLNVLAGLHTPDTGTLTWQDDAMSHTTHKPPPHHVSYVGHRSGMSDSLTLFDNLAFWAHARHIAHPQEKIHHALVLFQLDALCHAPTILLSAGQQKRASLARLLLGDTPLWLLDEPCAHLDDKGQQTLLNAITHAQQQGTIIVYTRHHPIDHFPLHHHHMMTLP